MAVLALSGCGDKKEEKKPEFIVINDEEVSVDEFYIYFMETVKNFEEIGGYDIWETDFDGRDALDVAKDSALNSMLMVKISAQKAGELDISVSEKEAAENREQVSDFLKKYGIEQTNENKLLMEKVLNDETLYSKMKQYVIKDYKISEAEYRVYCESYYESAAAGLRYISLDGIFCQSENKINEAHKKILAGEDFYSVQKEYNDYEMSNGDTKMTMNQSELENDFGDDIILENGFVSNPIETDEGHAIFRVSEINEGSEDEIINKLRDDYTNSVWQDIFTRELDKWQKESVIYINDETWGNITFGNVTENQLEE